MITKRSFLRLAGSVFLLLGFAETTNAQLMPFGASYYHNRYQINPAYAGLQSGLDLAFGYRQQWSGMPGSPKLQYLTGSYALGKNTGIGLNLSNEKAGLLAGTRGMASFAYHLPLGGNDQKLSLGASAGFKNERVDRSLINGDPTDAGYDLYNGNKNTMDGDIGLAFTSKGLTIDGAVLNLRQRFDKDQSDYADQSTFYSAISYKVNLAGENGQTAVEPRFAFRGVKGSDNIWDAGLNVAFAQQTVELMSVYHSSKSVTFGLNVNYNAFSFLGIYTAETSKLRNNTNGSFEIGIRARVL